jgi:hypothetical protein
MIICRSIRKFFIPLREDCVDYKMQSPNIISYIADELGCFKLEIMFLEYLITSLMRLLTVILANFFNCNDREIFHLEWDCS